MKRRLFACTLLAASAAAHAATVLEYDVTGTCATEFSRVTFDGLYARMDQSMDGRRTSVIYDDSEHLMQILMHDTRNVMTMESDDEAVDFQSDVGKSTMLFAGNQTRELTGTGTNPRMAQARGVQAAACPELAQMGFADPDYAEAAARCTETMSKSATAMMSRDQMMDTMKNAQGAAQGDGRSDRLRNNARTVAQPGTDAAPVPPRTTVTDRNGPEESINGLTCHVETTRRGSTVLREQCVLPVDQLGLDASPMRRIKRIVKVGEGMAEGIASLHPDRDPDRDQPASLPLRRTCYQGGKQTGTATLRIDRNAVADAALFEVAAGYTPLDTGMPDGMDSMEVDAVMPRR